jgi:hypothetical protein
LGRNWLIYKLSRVGAASAYAEATAAYAGAEAPYAGPAAAYAVTVKIWLTQPQVELEPWTELGNTCCCWERRQDQLLIWSVLDAVTRILPSPLPPIILFFIYLSIAASHVSRRACFFMVKSLSLVVLICEIKQ